MADLQLTVRNLYCYPCGLSFSDEDSFRHHHNSHEIPSISSLIDIKTETEIHAQSEETESSSPTKKNRQGTKNPRKKTSTVMEMENSSAVKRAANKISRIKLKSKSKGKEKNNSVLQSSNKINLSKYKDYIHCCKCFSTFYTLTDLINHFDKCNVQRDENTNFKDFQQQNSHNLFPQVNTTTKITTTTIDEEENQLLNDDFMNQEISCSPLTSDNNNDNSNDDEGEKKIDKNNYVCSTSRNSTHVSFNSSPQVLTYQNEDSSDIEIKSEPESESASEFEPEIQSESEMEEEKVKGGKKKSKGKSGQKKKQNQKPKQPNVRLDIPFKCPVESCSSLSFPNLPSFQRHRSQVHNINETKRIPSLCPTCGKSVPSQFDLLVHINEHTDYKPYKCHFESCDKSFTTRKSYLQHLQITHENKKKILKCPVKTESGCDQTFTSRKELRQHVKIFHPVSMSFKCNICDEGFLTADDRYNHNRKVHRERSFVCGVENCEKSFRSIYDLKRHRLTHQPKAPIERQLKVKQKWTVKKHTKVSQQNQEQCLCSQCGKTFRGVNNYRRHLLVHTQEKSFICQFCGRAFSLLNNLKEHILIHSDVRKRKCRFCDKTFRRWSAHNRHEQTHIKIHPYKCAFCDATFPDNRPLKKHVAGTHADQEFDLNTPSTYQREKPSSSLNQIPEQLEFLQVP